LHVLDALILEMRRERGYQGRQSKIFSTNASENERGGPTVDTLDQLAHPPDQSLDARLMRDVVVLYSVEQF